MRSRDIIILNVNNPTGKIYINFKTFYIHNCFIIISCLKWLGLAWAEIHSGIVN